MSSVSSPQSSDLTVEEVKALKKIFLYFEGTLPTMRDKILFMFEVDEKEKNI